MSTEKYCRARCGDPGKEEDRDREFRSHSENQRFDLLLIELRKNSFFGLLFNSYYLATATKKISADRSGHVLLHQFYLKYVIYHLGVVFRRKRDESWTNKDANWLNCCDLCRNSYYRLSYLWNLSQ